MSISLLVPIGLHALCVGKPDAAGGDKSTAEFARIAADFSSLPYLEGTKQNPQQVGSGPNLSQQALPKPFSQVEEPLEPGIHLHWTLPEALAHTYAGETGPAKPRLAPNRWLVARVAATTGTAPASEIRAWIVESDLLWEGADKNKVKSNKLSRSYPLAEPGPAGEVPNRAVKTIGRTFPYEGWSETADGEYSKPHTALGYSEITYAAAYAHSPNSFGFWDTLEDLDPTKFPAAETSVSYLVAGWYSSLAEDPLSAVVPSSAGRAQALAAIEAQLSWTFPDDGKGSVPEASLCSGLLTGLSWEPDKAYLEGPPQAPLKVAIGNTTTEALAALLAKQPGLGEVEPVLNALELGVLDGLRSGEDEALENAEHEAGFGHETGGIRWIVKPTKTATPGAIPPAAVALALDELNAAQDEAEALEARLGDERAQLFADWQKYMTVTYPSGPPSSGTPSSEAAQEYIQDTVLAELKQLAAQTLAAAGKAKDKLGALEKALGGSADWEVGSISASRYWAAHEPVALLSGAGLDAVYRPSLPQSTDKAGNLQCRLSTTVLSAMTVSGQQAVTAANLPTLPTSPNRSHAAELAALAAEAFFADPHRAALLAAAAKGAASQQEIEAAQKGGTTGKVGFAGQWPAPAGLLEWKQPWIPLHMQWELEYHPLSEEGDYDPGFLLANFTLEPDGVELVDNSPPPSSPSQTETYNGTAVLARSGPASLIPQIENYIHNHPKDPNAALLEKVAAELEGTLGRQLLAQRLSGFNAALRMRMQTLQLPVRDPLAIIKSKVRDTFSNTRVREAVGSENRTAPLPENAFSPLRAGFARIARLRVIDVFGQKLDLAPQPTEVIRSQRLIPYGDNPADPYLGLPPRFAQPGRLNFRLLSAASDEIEMNSDPATSPIFGWVLFNHVENSLAIYDAAGTALGSLNVLGPLWTGAPGNDATFDKTPEEALENANPHLRDLVLGIYRHPEPVAFLKELLKTIDVATETIEPLNSSQSQALSVLIGRPLALVRAGVDFELAGLPALNQSWDSFTTAVNENLPIAKRDCAKFPQLEVPVHLGKLANLEDGLVGYFATDAQQPYETFFATAGSGKHVTPPPPGTLRVAAAGERTHVSLLVDPRCGVHASCGMMPAKQVELPLSLTAPALKAIAVTFLAAPVLSSAARLSMPAPEEPGRTWSWVSTGSKSWSEEAIATPDASAADLSRQQLSEGWLKLEENK
jgi:hypothetical protein